MKALIPFSRNTTPLRAWPLALLLAALTLYTGCDSSSVIDDGGETLALRVTTVTQGYDPDEDGYMVMIDDVQEVAIGVNATVSVPNLSAGAHQIRLRGVSENCSATGPSTVQEGEESVNFIITCGLKGRIVFRCGIPELAFFNLCTIRANGTERTQLTTSGQLWGGGFSPDGTQIIYIRAGSPFIIDAEGGEPAPFLLLASQTGFTGASLPSWSPDGTKIAFSAIPVDVDTGMEIGPSNIFVADADGSNAVNLTHSDSLWLGGPSWSPDGSQLAYIANTEPDDDTIDDEWGNIYVMNADGTNQHSITAGTPQADLVGGAQWSPVDSRIVFMAAPSRDLRWIEFFAYMIESDGTNLEQISRAQGVGWRPDGEWLAFYAGTGEDPDGEPCNLGGQIGIMRPDGSERTYLSDCLMVDQGTSWTLAGGQ